LASGVQDKITLLTSRRAYPGRFGRPL